MDLDDCAVDGSHVRARKGGEHVGPSPIDRAHPGCKHHLIVDRRETPLAVTFTGGSRRDVTQFLPLIDAVPPIWITRGRPHRKPRRLHADLSYRFDKYRRLLWKRGTKPLIARRGVAHGSGQGKVRWVAERAFARLHQFKRLDAPISIRGCSNWPTSYASAVCGHHAETPRRHPLRFLPTIFFPVWMP